MRTIVKNIHQGNNPEEFVVQTLVDGVEWSFRVGVVLPALLSITPLDRDFLDVLAYSMAPRKIAALVVNAYKGQVAEFPIDLGDI